VHDLAAGNMMVDRSIRAERLRPLSLSWTAACKRESRQLRELAGSLCVIWELGLGGRSAWIRVVQINHLLERLRPKRTQRVKAAPGEFAGERQRRPRVRESALLERQ
jgi:hypothetical protein